MALEWIKNEDFYEGQISHILRRKQKDPIYAKYSNIIKSSNLPFESLYKHQYDSIESYINGENICLTTGTSSGKTLVYAICINEEILVDSNSTAIIIYPTKALSRDQKKKLTNLYSSINNNIDVGIYDGDSTREEKNKALKSNILITNFQGLNYYMEHHGKWSDFFSNLKTVVIDEGHSYTGVTGINVSFITRRLKRIVKNIYNSNPQYIITSATIGNPKEHCNNLTGEQFEIFDKDTSSKSEKIITLWNTPSYTEDDTLKRKSSYKEVSKVLSSCIQKKNLKSLVFVRSRKMTELVAMKAREICDDNVKIKSYNAGHTKKERRRVESDLKKGNIDAVISTNALELGIDIGELDCVILEGYPGGRNSFWQQVGRSGRDNSKSYVFLVAKNNTLDQYIIRNPEYLFDKNVEDCVVDLNNETIMKKHLLCACSEDPITNKDKKHFNKNLESCIKDLRENNYVKGNFKRGIKYNNKEMPQKYIDIYSIGNDKYEVRILKDNEIEKTLPSIDKERAFRDFHPGAIHIHKGVKYKVTDFSEKERRIDLKEYECDYTTNSSRTVNIRSINKVDSKHLTNNIKLVKGTGVIQQYYDSYSKFKDNGKMETGFNTKLDKPISIETQLVWFEINKNLVEDIKDSSDLGSLHAMEHALIKFSPALIKLDSSDLGGLSTLKHSLTNMPTVFIYDGVEGGIGFSWKIYDKINKLSEKTAENISNCECNYNSCPACTMSSSCGDDNEPLDAKGAYNLLSKI